MMIKSKIVLLLLILILCPDNQAQHSTGAEYTGVEYVQLKSELIRGWNTWDTKSVLTHVLMPEAIAVDFSLKDNHSGELLEAALMGRRGEGAETVLPVAHSYDGSYTELDISWRGIEMKVQTCAEGRNRPGAAAVHFSRVSKLSADK